ncbi:DUF2637 domain-containing protein [Streptomyces sp.]|uniref:DUF2637 domain-containing protein n=1 Tax=Streptomyces sp. TaxID=1931 RepID=UPI002D2EDF92|nr:DUF2637 domain-containing protein [Streptomyces sp.]HZF91943.1 DUF2637 domain-containing protein [Streptomyces sp.]
MIRSIRLDAVLVQAVIAGALSFAHLHDLAEAAGQSGWKAWAYPVSVDLLLVAAWRRLRTARRDRSAWTWFVIPLFASLGANIATAGLLDLGHVPGWLRILVAGWPALAFLGGTLLVHTPADQATPAQAVDEEPAAPEAEMHRTDAPSPNFRRSGRLDHFEIQRTRKGDLIMPQRAQITPVCRDCDGFATAAITTGTRQSDGSRATLRVTCRACKGTGHTTSAPAIIRAAR